MHGTMSHSRQHLVVHNNAPEMMLRNQKFLKGNNQSDIKHFQKKTYQLKLVQNTPLNIR